MGSGKSTVGKELQAILDGYELVDLDEYIERKAGRSIADIFEEGGEKMFRDMEAKAVEEILSGDGPDRNMILSLGGGTLTSPRVAKAIKDRTLNIYLRATLDTLVENLTGAASGRPMLKGSDLRTRVGELMDARGQVYEDTARHIVDTDGKGCDEVARKIAELVR